jgi:hypothetical protein
MKNTPAADKQNMYQFIVITYNHEGLILDNLNSIKYQVENYGYGRKVILTIIDDCSQDKTVELVNDFLVENDELFQEAKLMVNSINLGIKKTWIKSVDSIFSDKFKMLAGDDVYLKHSNIFDFMDFCFNKSLVFSPTYTYGRLKNSTLFYVGKLLLLRKHPILVKKLIDNNINVFNAPGSFVSREILSSIEYKQYLANSGRDYEDWPTWQYLFIEKSETFQVLLNPYIDYRPSNQRDKKSLIKATNTESIKLFRALKQRLDKNYGWILLALDFFGIIHIFSYYLKLGFTNTFKIRKFD